MCGLKAGDVREELVSGTGRRQSAILFMGK